MLRILGGGRFVGFASQDSIDIDMKNAHPKIMLNMVREVSPSTRFPFLEKYCARYNSWGNSIGDYLGSPKDVDKVEMAKIFYGARPSVEPPHILNLTLSLYQNRNLSLAHKRNPIRPLGREWCEWGNVL